METGDLAYRLSEAVDPPTAAERLAEYVRDLLPGAGVRIYVLGAGDRCGTCTRAKDCALRDRCLHLASSQGQFEQPRGHDLRVPRTDPAWVDSLGGGPPTRPETIAPELRPAADAPPLDRGEESLLVPLESGGEVVGVLGIRLPKGTADVPENALRTAAFLTGAAIRSLTSRETASRRYEQLLLVNELGRKVNAILNDELLLRQAAVDIHRTFGFHNVMIFMVDETRSHLELKAQASRYTDVRGAMQPVSLGEGVIGRVYRSGRAETIDDVSTETDYVDWYPDTKSESAVPIQIGGVVEGVLNVESDRVAAFGPDDVLVLETVANQLAIAIENARLFGMVKEREDRYRTLVESSPAGVLHLDADGQLIYANPAVTDITGYERGEILSRLSGLPELAVEVEREKLTNAVSEAMRGVPQRQLEFNLAHAAGESRFVSAALQPLIGDHGDPKGVVVLLRDMTRERELQDKLTQSEKLGAIGTLVSGVAHELNNPLAGILGFSQLLLGRAPEQWTRQDIEKIEKNARRCQRIVENLLAFARQSRMTKRRAKINEVIDSVLNLNEFQFRMDNVEIVRDFDARIPAFPLDVNRWQQVFVNLASNAHQALVGSDSPEREIRFETRLLDSAVRIRVTDTGPGVPEHLRHRIFEPFFTTRDKGTGLGLGICFGIVQEHGGTIELETTLDGGAAFTIELPIREAPEFLPQETQAPARPTSDMGTGRRVLIVDDDAYVCDVVSRALQNHHYEITIARDGEQAFASIQRESFDVIVTDVRMPGEIDGIELFDRVAALKPHLTDRFVFMTGNLLDTRTMGRLENMRVRFVEKPFDIHHLSTVVHEIAARAEVASSNAESPAESTPEA
jgi:two-component system NtrC family sensor kinase